MVNLLKLIEDFELIKCNTIARQLQANRITPIFYFKARQQKKEKDHRIRSKSFSFVFAFSLSLSFSLAFSLS